MGRHRAAVCRKPERSTVRRWPIGEPGRHRRGSNSARTTSIVNSWGPTHDVPNFLMSDGACSRRAPRNPALTHLRTGDATAGGIVEASGGVTSSGFRQRRRDLLAVEPDRVAHDLLGVGATAQARDVDGLLLKDL